MDPAGGADRDNPASEPPAESELQRMLKNFGAHLRFFRQRANLTQEQVGDTAGCGRSYVSAVEAGEQNLTLSLADALARAVGGSVVSFLQSIERESTEAFRAALETGVAPPPPAGTLAIELPEGQAFQVARDAARKLGTSIPLVNPTTREVAALVPTPSQASHHDHGTRSRVRPKRNE